MRRLPNQNELGVANTTKQSIEQRLIDRGKRFANFGDFGGKLPLR